jgi:predicted DNA-binding transcriptional regulator YafY
MRARRLLDLLEALRRYRRPVTARTLAATLDISLRTLYRDIATLQAQGAPIEGETGLGYVLKPGFTLPPLMFSREETEALVLGSRWVAARADDRLGTAARHALAKIAAVLPADLRGEIDDAALLIGPGTAPLAGNLDIGQIREAIKRERVVTLAYRDKGERATTRAVWPFALAYFDQVRVVVAWCTLRHAFRHFRADRIVAATIEAQRYPKRRVALMAEWRKAEGIAAASF